MVVEYVMEGGVTLKIGRIPRQMIDRFSAEYREPEPPTKAVMTWAEVEEQVPDYDDPAYLAELADHYRQLIHDQVTLIAAAVTLDDDGMAELGELQEANLSKGDSVEAFLRYSLNPEDQAAVVEEVLYQSTVTPRNLAEAARAFRVTWRGGPVQAWRIPNAPGSYSWLFEARKAAQYSHLRWHEFCEMGGPEQAEAVAFYRLSARLEWLMMQEAR